MKSGMNMDGQVALVTGGASGIGAATCQALADAGASIVVLDRSACNGWDHVIADLSNPAEILNAIEGIVGTHGRIDALVHSAGIGLERSFLDTSLEEWTRLIDIDLTGTFLVCQAVASVMVKQRYGRIVTMASTAGVRGGTGRAAYGAAKGGVITLTKVMAVELAEFGITANALAPGAIETELVRQMHSAETRHVYRRSIPMDRYGTPDEVAAVAAFLCSPAAEYVSGQVLGVDGGFLAAGVLHRKHST
jgi:NAD(P)-dependent dehydrogenase (short-subunit alcohol dehydrogenase family)